MKNVKSYFNRKSENRTFDTFTNVALSNTMMNMVLGGLDPQYPQEEPDEAYFIIPPKQN
jgi:hypothetical protein